MIQFRKLVKEIHDVETISAKDIFNFYYLWHFAVNEPKLANTSYSKEVIGYYTQQFKQKYLRLFSKLLYKQLAKYVSRGRVEPDFPTQMVTPSASPKDLAMMMKKTFRSDMKRHNDRWDLICDFTENLSNSTSAKDIFTWVNQLNNAVHNTKTNVLDKFPNYYSELVKAFDTVAKAKNMETLKGFVDKDIRDLQNQNATEDEPPNPDSFDECVAEGLSKVVFCESEVSYADRHNHEFVSGFRIAVQDKKTNSYRDLKGYSPDFIRGYKTVKRVGWWDKANARLTQWASNLGNDTQFLKR